MDDASVRNFQYLTYGLSAAWLILLLYVGLLLRRDGRIEREMQRLRGMLEDKEKK